MPTPLFPSGFTCGNLEVGVGARNEYGNRLVFVVGPRGWLMTAVPAAPRGVPRTSAREALRRNLDEYGDASDDAQIEAMSPKALGKFRRGYAAIMKRAFPAE